MLFLILWIDFSRISTHINANIHPCKDPKATRRYLGGLLPATLGRYKNLPSHWGVVYISAAALGAGALSLPRAMPLGHVSYAVGVFRCWKRWSESWVNHEKDGQSYAMLIWYQPLNQLLQEIKNNICGGACCCLKFALLKVPMPLILMSFPHCICATAS